MNQYRHTIASVAQLFVNGIGFIFVYFQYINNGNNPTLMAIFFLFACIVIADKLGAVFSGFSLDKDKQETMDMYEKIPPMFIGSPDIVTFYNIDDGLKYCISASSRASHIKNTVMRYGAPTSLSTGKAVNYNEWLATKEQSLIKGTCTWTELVSSHIDSKDQQLKIMCKPFPRGRYNRKIIDDKICPVVQMSIFYFKDGEKEVIWGWEFPGIEHGPSFLSRNEKVIEFFEKYFSHLYSNVAIELPN